MGSEGPGGLGLPVASQPGGTAAACPAVPWASRGGWWPAGAGGIPGMPGCIARRAPVASLPWGTPWAAGTLPAAVPPQPLPGSEHTGKPAMKSGQKPSAAGRAPGYKRT